MLKNIWISKNFNCIYNEKNFLLSVLSPPNNDLPERNYPAIHHWLIEKISVSGTKIFEQRFTGIYKLNICFPSALPLGMRTYSSWMSADVFSDTNQKHVFACCCVWQECIFYNVELFEVYKMSEVFWAKKYCKMRDIFASFSWLWDFLTENLKLVDKLQM